MSTTPRREKMAFRRARQSVRFGRRRRQSRRRAGEPTTRKRRHRKKPNKKKEDDVVVFPICFLYRATPPLFSPPMTPLLLLPTATKQ